MILQKMINLLSKTHEFVKSEEIKIKSWFGDKDLFSYICSKTDDSIKNSKFS